MADAQNLDAICVITVVNLLFRTSFSLHAAFPT